MSAEMGAGIGAVAASAGPAIGASIGAGAEIGAASIPSFGAETFATQIPSIYSGIPSAIEPVGIETFSPSLGLINELDSPPASLGEFTIEDLIGKPQTIGITHLEPAIDTSPVFVEEISAPQTSTEISGAVKIVEEEAFLFLPIIPEEETEEVEKQKDEVALKNAVETLTSFEFSEEETQAWQQKLEAAIQLEETETEVEVQTLVTSQEDDEPPIVTNVATGIDDIDEEEVAEKVEEETILLYKIGHKIKSAEKVNKWRAKLADQIATEVEDAKNPRTTAEAEIALLDIPEFDDAMEISQGKLFMPTLSHKIEAALSTTDETDPYAIAKTVTDIVDGNKSTRLVEHIEGMTPVQKKDLDPDAKKLLEEGEDKLVFKKLKKHWMAVKALPFVHPYEVQRTKKAA